MTSLQTIETPVTGSLKILNFSESIPVIFTIIPRVPPPQNKTCTRTAVTTQNMYTYRCHNTKHVHVPLSQHKTCTRTAVTIQNIYTYRCHNTKHVCVALGTANINAYFHDTIKPLCVTCWQVWKSWNVPTSDTKSIWKTQISHLFCIH